MSAPSPGVDAEASVVPTPSGRYVRPGTAGQTTELLPFRAGDGTRLTLLHVTRADADPTTGGKPAHGPVLLVHGAGVRAEIFRPPQPRTLVDALLDEGFDVWLLNWRASIDLPPVAWTLDQAAAYDFPAAVRLVLEHAGAAELKVFAHCQGSTSLVMAAISGLLPQVSTIVSSAVSLHPVVPAWSWVKLQGMSPAIRKLSPTLSPRWGYRSEGPFSRALEMGVALTHRECDNKVCKLVSFTYGSGRPALWSHSNLDRATHDWITGEFAGSPMTFFAQMRDCVRAGHLVRTGFVPEILPDLTVAPRTDARFVLVTGANNRCFLPDSQRRTFEHLERLAPGRHALHVFEGYGHLDVIFGVNAWRDTHPIIVRELASGR